MSSKSRIAKNRMPQATDGAAAKVRESYDAAANLVTDNPAKSILIVFGVGFALGMLLGHALGEPPREESSVTRFGRSMMDRMGRMMPESMSKWCS